LSVQGNAVAICATLRKMHALKRGFVVSISPYPNNTLRVSSRAFKSRVNYQIAKFV
jgi:hypothetical protein